MSGEDTRGGSTRRTRQPIGDDRLKRAIRIVRSAWHDLPTTHQRLLQNIGAAQWNVVDRPLGAYVDELLRSGGYDPLTVAGQADLDVALGVWVPPLRLILVDAGHASFLGTDEPTYEAMLARVAWHEWGHALSVQRASSDDVAAGERLLELAPSGVSGFIRGAGYRSREYTHELVAEIYALLMSRRRRGQAGQPRWLHDEIYELVRRTTGWSQ